MQPQLSIVLASLVLLSGCLGPASVAPASDNSSEPSPTATAEPGSPRVGVREPSAPRTGSIEPPVPQAAWPPLSQASIRPGVRTVANGMQCTSNFLFRSLDNSTLYLGVASHCVDGLAIGDAVQVSGAKEPGKLAYSSWLALGLDCAADALGTSCTQGDFENDFALIEISSADRARTHPAVLSFGGPTALVDSKTLKVGHRVLNYGNSGTWGGKDLLREHEGILTYAQAGPQFRILTLAPGVKGDSGSPVLTVEGEAAGVLVTGCLSPCPGQSGIVGLKTQLDLAAAKGFPVELATWSLLHDGVLP